MTSKYLGFSQNFIYSKVNRELFDSKIRSFNFDDDTTNRKFNYIKQELPQIKEFESSIDSEAFEFKKIFLSKKCLNLEEIYESYQIFERIFSSKQSINKDVEKCILVPILQDIPLTYEYQLFQLISERFNLTENKDIWSSVGDNNSTLNYLRNFIIENNEELRIKNFFNEIDCSYVYNPFDKKETGYFESTSSFLKIAQESNLSSDAIDFIVSMSDWLYKYSPGDCEKFVKPILLKYGINEDYFDSKDYSFYVKRILEN